MLIGGIVLGLVLGLIAGGNLVNLASIQLRRLELLAVALLLRVVTEFLLNAGVPLVETFRLPLLAGAFGLLLVALWANRGYPGMILVFIGILSNAVVIVVNGGYMPIWEPALTAAGLTPADVTTALHYILPPPLDANFLLHLGPFADVIPIPLPDHPERRLDRRRVPHARSRVLPVRRGRSQPAGARRSRPGDHPRTAGAWRVRRHDRDGRATREPRPACRRP